MKKQLLYLSLSEKLQIYFEILSGVYISQWSDISEQDSEIFSCLDHITDSRLVDSRFHIR